MIRARTRPAALAAAATAMGAALAMGTAAGGASAATITVLDAAGNNDPVLHLPRVFRLTGNSPAPGRVYVKHRAPGGAPCAPNANSDSGTYLYDSRSFTGVPSVDGDFVKDLVVTWTIPGPIVFCIWNPQGNSASTSTITTPTTQTIDFRAPASTVALTPLATPPPPDTDFSIAVTGNTEAPSRLYVALAGPGAVCGPTYSGHQGTRLVAGSSVNGAFSVPVEVSGLRAGTYTVCTWVAQSSDDTTPGAGPRGFPLAVAAPPPPAFSCTLPSRASSLSLPATAGQLRINQRIAIAAVRRLNAIRARLEGRPAPATPRGSGGVIRPTTGQLRINQRISEAGFTRARSIYNELGGTGAPSLTPRASSITFTRAGVGINQLTNIRALDMLNCINRNLG